jgi:NAD(P)H-quinone oxidoreductase subunit K
MDAVIKLRKKVSNDSLQERGNLQQTHRYHTVRHNMRPVPEILTGTYLNSGTREAPPKQLLEAMGMPVPPALLTAQKEEVRRG